MTQKELEKLEKEVRQENKRFFNTVKLEKRYEKEYELKENQRISQNTI